MNKEQIALELTKIYLEQNGKISKGYVLSNKFDLLKTYNYFLDSIKGEQK